MSKYKFQTLERFNRDYKKFKKDKNTLEKIDIVVEKLLENPFDYSLKTHQVDLSSLGQVYSSRVTGDLRLIWDFDENDSLIIIAIRLQGHDTVYK